MRELKFGRRLWHVTDEDRAPLSELFCDVVVNHLPSGEVTVVAYKPDLESC